MLQTPPGLNPGDPFRFVFVTDGIRDATSTNIADYDSFVNAQAGGATYSGVVVDWLAIGSTDSVDAIDHVGQATAPVYLSDGTLVTTTTTLCRTLVEDPRPRDQPRPRGQPRSDLRLDGYESLRHRVRRTARSRNTASRAPPPTPTPTG